MRGLLEKLAKTTPSQVDVGLLLLRVWFGGVMAIGHGWGKVSNLEGFIGKVGKMGLPMPELLGGAAAFSELLGGLLVAIGLFARPAATTIVGTMAVAAFYVHAADPFGKKEFALAYLVAALVIVIAGPGRWSLDRRIFGGKP